MGGGEFRRYLARLGIDGVYVVETREECRRHPFEGLLDGAHDVEKGAKTPSDYTFRILVYH